MKNRSTMTRAVIIALVAMLLLSFLGLYASADAYTRAKSTPSVSAKSAVLYVPDTKQVLYSKSSDERLPMASTTKIMTALVTISECELTDTVKIDERAVGIEGSSAYLKAGDILSVEELLYALMLQSANDAAVALAYHIAGGVEEFSELMNEKALRMGLSDTHFTNPHGLDDEEHYTTAADLAVMASELLSSPTLREIVSTYKKSFVTETRRRTYVNHNKLLLRTDGAIGVKTGFTKRSGRCLVGAAERDGLTLVTVTLDAPSDWSDHEQMLDYGYSLIERIDLADAGEIRYDIPVINGDGTSVGVSNIEGVSVIVGRAKHNIERHVRLSRFLCAPIKKGEVLGEVIFTLDGEYAGTVKLVAENDINIKKTGFFSRLFDK